MDSCCCCWRHSRLSNVQREWTRPSSTAVDGLRPVFVKVLWADQNRPMRWRRQFAHEVSGSPSVSGELPAARSVGQSAWINKLSRVRPRIKGTSGWVKVRRWNGKEGRQAGIKTAVCSSNSLRTHVTVRYTGTPGTHITSDVGKMPKSLLLGV